MIAINEDRKIIWYVSFFEVQLAYKAFSLKQKQKQKGD